MLSASPAQVVREVMTEAGQYVSADALVVSASKGIENETLLRMDEVLGQILRNKAWNAFVCFRARFAKEVVVMLPRLWA
ncbi:MAG: hypothetical protein CM1200mP14_22720 [Gammaproteobacteria bacterium]|nr:MAG: hypothetical protein CM1200mP14_22720 [Gammaproteobacteria bacterium]